MRREVLPPDALVSWAKLNDVEFHGAHIAHLGDDRGFGAVAQSAFQVSQGEPLMVVPADLILSAEAVENWAKADQLLRELLTAVGELAQTARGAILIFLLQQITISSPDCHDRVGVSGPFTEYVKFLAPVSLPTAWTEEEQMLLVGTSLEAALRAKLHKLHSEYDQIRDSTMSLPWCRRAWWGEEAELLQYEDWVLVDSWYRSRALSFGVDADALVAVIDMFNHTRGEPTNVFFDKNEDGNVVILSPEDKKYEPGQEITISYGDNKSASEMLFSYGFLNEGEEVASALSLDLEIPVDDPLKRAKEAVMTVAPAVRISLEEQRTKWESDAVWLSCANEEDGLQFQVLQSNDGGRELRMFWKDQDITEDSSRLVQLLETDPLWDIFQLRAVATVQARIADQIQRLIASDADVEAAHPHINVAESVWKAATTLRYLEKELLLRAYEDLEEKKGAFLQSKVVQDYLGSSAPPAKLDDTVLDTEDFS